MGNIQFTTKHDDGGANQSLHISIRKLDGRIIFNSRRNGVYSVEEKPDIKINDIALPANPNTKERKICFRVEWLAGKKKYRITFYPVNQVLAKNKDYKSKPFTYEFPQIPANHPNALLSANYISFSKIDNQCLTELHVSPLARKPVKKYYKKKQHKKQVVQED
ncbi:hypothetical protein DRE_02621 [Drechslerella stenobrocha 248]|uniref:Galectin domain-containing protein n=1 Tax=Drechslerella stenobrocha 248 TaxID=1043628 RepID=W7I7G3_9PEZI|nr:hypothetical protein DRE_02621 [Drechslerella stenobrocha 248]